MQFSRRSLLFQRRCENSNHSTFVITSVVVMSMLTPLEMGEEASNK